ncbi:MAG: DUF262 domain-containing protein, partial [Thermoplasmatota archaeon]
HMAKRNRLTNNSDETDISSLLSGDVIFSIPFFQRAYKWKPARLKQLNEDILTLVDEASEFHFLGAVIMHGRSSNPSDPKVFDVIDGQQRVTTLYLYLAATVKTLADLGEVDEAVGLLYKYLVVPRDTSLPSNLKLHSCREDRAQLNLVMRDVVHSPAIKEKLGSFKPKFLPSSGNETGTLRNNYKSALRFLKTQNSQGGIARVRDSYQALLENMSMVQIDVWDPTNGPKIFDSLNSRQEPMTIGDLVRNEVFAKVAAEHPEVIEQIDQNHWQPFYKKFQVSNQNLFDAYFFPYGLVLNSNLKKSEVYSHLREEWNSIDDPAHIIEELARYQDAFIDLATGQNTQRHGSKMKDCLRRFYDLGAPSSTYPFLMQLSQGVKEGVISEKSAIETLSVIESFLVRRAVCGHEPTGLHAVFKKLWSDCGDKKTGTEVEAAIRKHKTVVWPNDDEFAHAISTRPVYGASICNFLLREYDRSLGGDIPVDIPWIEHVLPQTLSKQWEEKFPKEEHVKLKDTLANLVPLSKQMNTGLGNGPYEKKQSAYKEDSMYKTSRKFAESYNDWDLDAMKARGTELRLWALKRWQT